MMLSLPRQRPMRQGLRENDGVARFGMDFNHVLLILFVQLHTVRTRQLCLMTPRNDRQPAAPGRRFDVAGALIGQVEDRAPFEKADYPPSRENGKQRGAKKNGGWNSNFHAAL